MITNLYLWLKALHVIAIIAWMAALLYLPRLFVYHVDAAAGSVQSETFKVMERRLLKAIATPAMLASWAFGLAVAHVADAWSSGWFHIKLACVLGLTVIHMMLARQMRRFAEDRNEHTAKYFRILNEVPTLLMIVIVVMVIVKPV